jgi:2,3-bisphosphoglycerate-dependent phosphoglycerate mutase
MTAMTVEIVFETHALTEDNERGVATGWLPGRLSERGRVLAAELGVRRRDEVSAVFCSDLARAAETAEVAVPGASILPDWRLRECDYGALNGTPSSDFDKRAYLDVRFPGGESWREAYAATVGSCETCQHGGTVSECW